MGNCALWSGIKNKKIDFLFLLCRNGGVDPIALKKAIDSGACRERGESARARHTHTPESPTRDSGALGGPAKAQFSCHPPKTLPKGRGEKSAHGGGTTLQSEATSSSRTQQSYPMALAVRIHLVHSFVSCIIVI